MQTRFDLLRTRNVLYVFNVGIQKHHARLLLNSSKAFAAFDLVVVENNLALKSIQRS